MKRERAVGAGPAAARTGTRRARPRTSEAPVAESSVRRLSHYYRVLEEAHAGGERMISSHRLADREGVTSAQIRKDLSYFGSFGRRGLGYNVEHLRLKIGAILGLDRRWRVAVVGAGHVGSALVAYPGFRGRGFDVVAVFDRERARIGGAIHGLAVRDVAGLEAAAASEGFDVGVIATPIEAAQSVADALVRGGVRGILNFAPGALAVPASVTLRTVDLIVEFESLSFALSRARPARRRRRG